MEEIKNLSLDATIINTGEDKNVDKKENLNIGLYLSSKTISLLGTNVYSFALSLYILKLTGSGISFAMNILIGMLPRILLGPFAGIFADRVDRKKTTIILDAVSGIVVFTLLLTSSIFGLKVVFIYTACFFLSLISVFYDTALGASLPNLVRDEKLMKINAYSNVSMSFAGILSPVIGGIIYGFMSINVFLIINGLSFIISAMLEIFIIFDLNKPKNDEIKEPMTIKNIKKDMMEIINYITEQSVLKTMFKYALMINLFINASMSVVYPFIINKILKMSPAQFGIIEASFSVGILITSIIVGSLKEKEKKIKGIAIGLGSIGLILILMGLPTINSIAALGNHILFACYILFQFIMGVIIILINTPLIVMLQRLTPDNLRGRFTGILGTLTNGIVPLGVITAGILIDKVPPLAILTASGIITILSSIKMLYNKNLKDF